MMKALKLKHRRIQSLMLTAVMLGGIFTATTGWTEGAGNFHFWDGDSYAIDFTGTLSDYHDINSHGDSSKNRIIDGSGTNGSACFMSIEEPNVDAAARGTSLKTVNSGSNATMVLSQSEVTALKDNIYQVKFSVLTNGVGTFVGIGSASNTSALINIAYITGGGNVRIGNHYTSGATLCSVDTQKWIDFEEIVVLRDGIYMLYYTVKQEGTVIKTGKVAMTLANGTALTSDFSLKRVAMSRSETDSTKATPTYFDDLSIRKYTGEIELLHYDFESSTTLSDYNKAAVNGVASAAIGVRMEGDSHGNTLKLSRNADATAESTPAAALPLGVTLSSGQYKFTYSVFPNGSPVTISAGEKDPYATIGYINSEGYVRHAPTDKDSSSFCRVNTQEWVDFETIVDLDNRRISYLVKQNGTEVGFQALDLTAANGTAFDSTRTITRVRPTINTTGTCNEIYFDDLTVSIYTPTPTLTDARIAFTDVLGTTVTGNANETGDVTVRPALESITMDFGCELDAATLAGVALKAKGTEDSVALSASSTGVFGEYVLKPTAFLKGNTDYTLTIPATVTATNGNALAEPFVLDFRTGAEETMASISGVTDKNNAALTSLTQLAADENLNVKLTAINMSGGTMDLMMIAAYYKDDCLLDVSVQELSLKDGAALTGAERIQSMVLPKSVSEADSLRILLWDGTGSLKPYDEPFKIPADQAKVSFDSAADALNAAVTNDL